MADMTAALRGLRWQYANDRIGLAALERKVEDALRLEAREPAPVSRATARSPRASDASAHHRGCRNGDRLRTSTRKRIGGAGLRHRYFSFDRCGERQTLVLTPRPAGTQRGRSAPRSARRSSMTPAGQSVPSSASPRATRPWVSRCGGRARPAGHCAPARCPDPSTAPRSYFRGRTRPPPRRG
jgi:hypothetical protein